MHFSLKVALFCCSLFFFQNTFSQEINEKKLIKHLVYLSSDELEGRKTGTKGNQLAREYIRSEFESYGLATQYSKYFQRFAFYNRRDQAEYEDAINVVGFIPGSESRQIIVISAHYDHLGIGKPNAEGDSIYNGADDNASGTAALLALAEYFSENRPQHAIMFVAFDAEEMGLQGARALLKDFPFDTEQILLNVNMDMIGRNDKGEIYASGTYQNPNLKPILESAVAAQGSPTLRFGHDEPGTGRDDWTMSSDHGPFASTGIPHIYFGVEDHDDYHTQNDEFTGISPEFFSGAANLILKCILELDSQLLE
ncbi:M28 family peptidase [Algoriphagus namhaensis]